MIGYLWVMLTMTKLHHDITIVKKLLVRRLYTVCHTENKINFILAFLKMEPRNNKAKGCIHTCLLCRNNIWIIGTETRIKEYSRIIGRFVGIIGTKLCMLLAVKY